MSEAELLQELNSSHSWMLPGNEGDDFSMEDVAAYVKQEGAEPPAPRQRGGKAKRGKPGGGAGGAASPLDELAAAAAAAAAGRDGVLPDWARQLQAEGFDVQAKAGEIFLQRGSAPLPRPRPSSEGVPQHQERAARPAAGARAAAAAVAALPDSAFAVGEEFEEGRWLGALAAVGPGRRASRGPVAQRTFQDDNDDDAEEGSDNGSGFGYGSAAAGPSNDPGEEDEEAQGPLGDGAAWWLGAAAGDAASAVLQLGTAPTAVPAAAAAAAAAAIRQGQQPPAAPPSPAQRGAPRDWQQRQAAAERLQGALFKGGTPEQLLQAVEAAYPEWSANNCRLIHQSRGIPVAAPGPAEAALAMKGAALAARRRRLKPAQMMSLARDRRIRGLAECLRVTPPRSAGGEPSPPPAVARRMWAAAKAYWLPPDATDLAATAAAVAGRDAGDAGAGSPPAGAQSAGAGSDVAAAAGVAAAGEQQPGAAGGGAPVNGLPANGHGGGLVGGGSQDGQEQLAALVAKVRAGGVQLTRSQVEAARRLLELRQVNRQRREAFASAIWALSVIGGPWLFEEEMEALLQVAAPSLPSWLLSGREVSDVLWALANARHWTALLPQLEAAVVRAGGLRALRPPQVTSVLWAFATLAHTPGDLLEGLAQTWGAGRAGGLRALQEGQLSAVVWSLAVMQQVDSKAFRLAWSEVCRRGLAMGGQKNHLVQIWQAALALKLESSSSSSSSTGGGSSSGGAGSSSRGPAVAVQAAGAEQLLAAAEAAVVGEAAALRGQAHSSYQRAIANALTGMRVMHVLEDSSTGYSIDVSIPSLKVAIEADGPSHIARNKRKGAGAADTVQLGATLMKARHLRRLGWRVINVTFEEWDALGSSAAKAALLRRRIDEALAA